MIGVLRSAASTPGLEYERRPEPMSGGFWADLFSFSLANPPGGWPAELVARLMPDPGTAGKETIVQRAVAAVGFPTPFVRVSGGPDGGLGQAGAARWLADHPPRPARTSSATVTCTRSTCSPTVTG